MLRVLGGLYLEGLVHGGAYFRNFTGLLIGSTYPFPGGMSPNSVKKKITNCLHFKIMQYLALGLQGDF